MNLMTLAASVRARSSVLWRTKYANECHQNARELEDAIEQFRFDPNEDVLRALVALHARAKFLLHVDSPSVA